VVRIFRRGTVLFTIETGAHFVFTDVFFISAVESSVISLGQLDENWFEVKICHLILTICDTRD
jgi:hypothetical protein